MLHVVLTHCTPSLFRICTLCIRFLAFLCVLLAAQPHKYPFFITCCCCDTRFICFCLSLRVPVRYMKAHNPPLLPHSNDQVRKCEVHCLGVYLTSELKVNIPRRAGNRSGNSFFVYPLCLCVHCVYQVSSSSASL